MSGNVCRFRGISGNIGECREVSGDFGIFRVMSGSLGGCWQVSGCRVSEPEGIVMRGRGLEGEALVGGGGHERDVLLLGGEVLLDDVVGHLVYLDLLVSLQLFDLVDTAALLDHVGDLLCVLTRHLQHVAQPIEHHLQLHHH